MDFHFNFEDIVSNPNILKDCIQKKGYFVELKNSENN